MKKAMFSDAKVGDGVWGLEYGEGIIHDIRLGTTRPLLVYFGIGIDMKRFYYTLEGKNDPTHLNPTLFYNEVKIVLPERPKEHHVCDWEYMQSTTHYWERCPVCQACRKYGELPKEKCEACERLEKYSSLALKNNDIKFLLNQHHACSELMIGGASGAKI